MFKVENEKVKTSEKGNGFTFGRIIDALTITAVAALLIVVALAYMTNITMSSMAEWKELGFQAAILYICSVSVTLLLRSFGRRKGRETEEYKKASETVEQNAKDILTKGYAGRRVEYCRNWENEELKESRTRILSHYGVSLQDFEKVYCKLTKEELQKLNVLTQEQIECVLKTKKIKRLKYDEGYLSPNSERGFWRVSPSGGIKSSVVDIFKTAQILVSSAVSILLSVSMVLDVIANPTFGTVVACLVKISFILISGVSGLVGGYNLSAVSEVKELKQQDAEQKNFIFYCDTTPVPNKEAFYEETMDKTENGDEVAIQST